MAEDLVLVGASGLAREVISALAGSPAYRLLGIVDDNPRLEATQLQGVPVLGGIDTLAARPNVQVLVCVGRGSTRAALVDRLSAVGVGPERYATVIDPTVRVPDSCTIGMGSIVLAQVALTADVTVGQHVVVMPNVTLTHDDRVHDYATLCAGVTLGGSVRIGSAAYLGMTCSVRENVSVGDGAVLGMGAVLLQDLPAGQTWVGNPARPIRGEVASLPLPMDRTDGVRAQRDLNPEERRRA